MGETTYRHKIMVGKPQGKITFRESDVGGGVI
jgi:hypothetical protein